LTVIARLWAWLDAIGGAQRAEICLRFSLQFFARNFRREPSKQRAGNGERRALVAWLVDAPLASALICSTLDPQGHCDETSAPQAS
jgi:hypothetical protein